MGVLLQIKRGSKWDPPGPESTPSLQSRTLVLCSSSHIVKGKVSALQSRYPTQINPPHPPGLSPLIVPAFRSFGAFIGI